jgi:acyl-CoA hydrolase
MPDEHGWFSLGTNADYVTPLIGRMPVFLEANPRMPRTHGANGVHVSQIVGWCESDHPLVEVPTTDRTSEDEAIARYVAERVPDGATIQVGVGSTSSAVISQLTSHRDLGVHTELLGDGLMDLFRRGVVTGRRKTTRPGRMVTTFALGSHELYGLLDGNDEVEFLPVDWVNNPRVIGTEENFVSINATCEVDMLGQANSEMIRGRMWSGSGGQADFAHGAMFSPNGKGFLTLHSTTSDGSTSRIKVRLDAGTPVTTLKNAIDHVVTEYGVAELFGQPVAERARRLIAIAHPNFRDQLTAEASALGILR